MERFYPRPSLRRDEWQSLDGIWKLNGKDIRVPYPPQSRLSGWEGDVPEKMIYERGFTPELPRDGQRMLLHFGAVDQVCHVYVNGFDAGTHEGGYLPFTFDITDYLYEGRNVIRVEAEDTLSHDYPYGKQKKKPGGMWYTPVSGIWQSVWYETVPEDHISGISFKTDIHTGEVSWDIDGTGVGILHMTVQMRGEVILSRPVHAFDRLTIPEDDLRFWTPDDPALYDVTFEVPSGDTVRTYFAFREFSVKDINGTQRLCLNGEPVFLNGVLDQGYYPDGIFVPGNLRDYDRDICLMKQMGFNTLRKHIKVEPEYFYSACDRLGMIVIQDMVNSGEYRFMRDTVLPTAGIKKIRDGVRDYSRREKFFIDHMVKTAAHLDGHPCIAVYTIFNEGGGQFESDRMYEILKERDTGRLIDSTSGWFAQQKSDFDSEHVYFREKELEPGRRPMLLSECGGFILDMDPGRKKGPVWGYGRCKDPLELTGRMERMYVKMVLRAVKKGLCGCIYTQLSDVENELNGLVTYDRKKIKVDIPRLQKISMRIDETLRNAVQERKE
ncbi:MAG: hypothetical protein J6P39_02215 [Oscillospiraceae bacterium]|nr:hypothetical protein [Oscillospiraceae bacterium]